MEHLPTRSTIKRQMEKVNRLAIKKQKELLKLSRMCEIYYGEENYNDHDEDEIIDCLEYGQGVISFDVFDRIMREINNKLQEG